MSGQLPKKICVVGLGYIGLPTAAVLASRGHHIHGVEVNATVVDIINSGKAHIIEPDLDMVVQASVQTGRLKAFQVPCEADIFMICVPTPLAEGNRPDLAYVDSAVAAIAPYVRPGNLVILESTSPPGTTDHIAKSLREIGNFNVGEVFFAHAPERVLPGKILREVIENDRIIGGVDQESTVKCAEFYRSFVTGQLLLTNARTAETAKLVENAYRDVNIAFANELSMFAESMNIDVWELIRLANHHPRVNILSPGPGVGGHCIAVDPWFLVHCNPEATRLIRTSREINHRKTDWVLEKVMNKAERFKRPTIACLGLSYKPDIDDLRESPALEIALALQKKIEGEVLFVEPYLKPDDSPVVLSELEEAVSRADIVVALVAHRQFLQMPLRLLSEKLVLDTCGVFRRT